MFGLVQYLDCYYTVGIRKPDMSCFRMVDHVWISNGFGFQMVLDFKWSAILSITIRKLDENVRFSNGLVKMAASISNLHAQSMRHQFCFFRFSVEPVVPNSTHRATELSSRVTTSSRTTCPYSQIRFQSNKPFLQLYNMALISVKIKGSE